MSASPALLARLRSRVAALEGIGRGAAGGVVALGVAALDRVLPWGGLPLGCLHEVVAAPVDGVEDGAATAFAAALLGRVAGARGRPVLWVAARPDLYAPGLAAFGLTPERLVVALARRPAEALWAMEEGARCSGLAAVLGEVRGLDLTAARRLQLAARGSGVAVLALGAASASGPAVTRWRVAAAPSTAPPRLGVGAWRWRVELLRCRGRGLGEEGTAWELEWDDATGGFAVAAAPADRPAAPPLRHAG
ncbi:ImuA family protein [Magnetospirillum sp. UT-4]|uniref:ImuA family protein n=1 Tax=Magnetospirillum sp. UT-4 TaxID=2681467 RepID=UPI00137C6C84|nr:hypothetical protein [Magnetospirillum sp. UT-4]CAA7621418.1 conserved hypothetical protein [Magnetospirillum sp. UT-4]